MTVVSRPQTAQQQDYDQVRQVAADIFDSPDIWLSTPHPMMGAKPPAWWISQGRKDLVLDLLAAIREGAFS